MLVFFSVVVAVGYVAAQYLGNPVFLYGAIALSVVMNVGSYWFSDTLALAATHATETSREQHPELWNVVENLAITAGLPMPKVYIINDPAPNAFATGRNPHHAAVAVTTGLLSLMNRSELEGVLAHELSHVGNRDILVMSVAVVLVGFIAVIADMMGRMALWGGGSNDNRNAGPLTVVFGVAIMILGPLVGQLMQLAVSRKREYLADASGALLTRYPEGLASALAKIHSYPAPLQHASSATAHLFISNPFGDEGSAGTFIRNLFSTHPPVEERIARLRSMAM